MRDLDLTKNKIFSSSNLTSQMSRHVMRSLNPLLINKINYEQDYGKYCICCGSEITYGETSDEQFLNSIAKVSTFIKDESELKELCTRCNLELSDKYHVNIYDESLLRDISTIKLNNDKALRLINKTELSNNMYKESDIYKKERDRKVRHARMNNINIWG